MLSNSSKSGSRKTWYNPLRARQRVTISEARLRAEECVIAAKEEGIAKEDIEEEVGDLVDYMSAAIEKAVNADVDRAVMKDRS